ncbi:hypothetical protein BDA99DRAFT_534618 [Phascolomyces articulosus]|uniref:Uncharacterized protein n=1 Tax=Phascolomyces articulosus TaxID=60185 RepID=A0AAD5KFI7_9FUNG|nr:hypothetical protein BDA99DRAFT_534618 [Phascolomyces articulosus]
MVARRFGSNIPSVPMSVDDNLYIVSESDWELIEELQKFFAPFGDDLIQHVIQSFGELYQKLILVSKKQPTMLLKSSRNIIPKQHSRSMLYHKHSILVVVTVDGLMLVGRKIRLKTPRNKLKMNGPSMFHINHEAMNVPIQPSTHQLYSDRLRINNCYTISVDTAIQSIGFQALQGTNFNAIAIQSRPIITWIRCLKQVGQWFLPFKYRNGYATVTYTNTPITINIFRFCFKFAVRWMSYQE